MTPVFGSERCRVQRAALAAVLVVAFVQPSMQGQGVYFPPPPTPSEADANWVEQHVVAARDTLLPLRDLPQLEFVAYRSSRDRFTDGPESHFAITLPQKTSSRMWKPI